MFKTAASKVGYAALTEWEYVAQYCSERGCWKHYVEAYKRASNQTPMLDRPDISYEYLNKFEKAYETHKYELYNDTIKVYLNLIKSKAFYYFTIGDKINALKFFKFYLVELQKDEKTNFSSILHNKLNLGTTEVALGNFQKAIECYSDAYAIQQRYDARNHSFLLRLNTSMGFAYAEINSYSQALLYYRKALIAKDSLEKSLKKVETIEQTYIVLYNSLADLYAKNKSYDTAIIYLNAALKYQDDKNPIRHLTLKKMADVYIAIHDNNKALSCLQEALTGAEHKFKRHFLLAQIHVSFANLYIKKGDIETALQYTQKALVALSEKFKDYNIAANPPLSEVYSKRDLLAVLDLKTELLLKKAAKQPNCLDIANQTVRVAENLIDIIRADCTSDFDKQFLSDLCYPVYEKSVRIAYQLYERDPKPEYLAAIYNAIEKNKASVLLEALKIAQAETELNETDRNRLYQLRSEIAKLEENLYREKNQNHKTLYDSTVLAYQERLKIVKANFETFTQRLEKQYPTYYQLKFGTLTRDMADIQKELPPNATLINYFVTDKAVYSIVLRQQGNPQVFKRDKGALFDSDVVQLRRILAERASNDAKIFAGIAHALYKAILADPLSIQGNSNDPNNPKRLIIIPDGVLNYIPFDVLTMAEASTTPRFAQLSYLLKDYTISYAYSAAAYWEQKRFKTGRAKKIFAGFAPTYNEDSTTAKTKLAFTTRSNVLRNLPGALKEVETATALFNGEAYTQLAASEQNFRENAPHYRVLHLGMHSLLNDKLPLLSHLVFTNSHKDSTIDNELTINELYGLRLHADLAVLSACNTGMGDINRGEGVISLSRAFTYAGVPATIMSLWEVEDFSTSKIIDALYNKLKVGQNKDEALRQAKLDYLQHTKTEAEAHPYYWAGLIATGNTAPLDLSTPLSLYWLLGIPLFGFIVWRMKKMFNNQKSTTT